MGLTRYARQGLSMPLDTAVDALRRLPPGTVLLEPESEDLRTLGAALLATPEGGDLLDWLRLHTREVMAVVLRTQLIALEEALGPIGIWLVRAAGDERDWEPAVRRSDPDRVLDRLRGDDDLRQAAIEWADAVGHRTLASVLRAPWLPHGADQELTDDELWSAAELAVSAMLPDAPTELDMAGLTAYRQPVPATGAASEFELMVDSVAVAGWGFLVTVLSRAPLDIARQGPLISINSFRWNGLSRIRDDLGHEYLILAADGYPTSDDLGCPRESLAHWCYPRIPAGVTELYVESGGHRIEKVRFFAGEDEIRPDRSVEYVTSEFVMTASLRG